MKENEPFNVDKEKEKDNIQDESQLTDEYLMKRLAEIDAQFGSSGSSSSETENNQSSNDFLEKNNLHKKPPVEEIETSLVPEQKVKEVEEEEGEDSEELDELVPTKKKDPNKLLKIVVLILFIVFLFILGRTIFAVFSNDPEPSATIPTTTTTPTTNTTTTPVVTETQKTIDDVIKEIDNTNIPVVNKPDKTTSSSNTYQNSALDISFSYPTDWIEHFGFQLEKTPDHVKNITMVGEPVESNVIDNMRITVETTPVTITSKEYIKQTEERMREIFPEFQSIDTGEITVSGREAPTRMYLWVPQEEIDKSPAPVEWKRIQQYQVYVSGKNKIYIVTFTGVDKEFSKNYQKYVNVLSTLKLGD